MKSYSVKLVVEQHAVIVGTLQLKKKELSMWNWSNSIARHSGYLPSAKRLIPTTEFVFIMFVSFLIHGKYFT